MSVVVPLKPEPEPVATASPTDADGWALLEGLKRRIDDQASIQRATQTQVTQLAESIGALVEVQRRRSKWLNLNSFVAYLIFTMLCGAGFFFLYRSRVNDLVAARNTAVTEHDTAVKRGDDATAKLAARDKAEAQAFEVYTLLESGKRAEAKAKLAALDPTALSRVERAILDTRARDAQVSEVDAALKAAAGAIKAGRHAEVIGPLDAALASEPAGARAPLIRYYLGIAYAKTGDLDKAIAMLAAATTADVDQEDARFQLASALDRKGELARARAEYDRFATAHPQSQLAVFAMRRSATLAHMPAQQPVAPPPAPKAVVAPPKAAAAPALPAKTEPVPETNRGEAMSAAPRVITVVRASARLITQELPVTSRVARAQELPAIASRTSREQALPAFAPEARVQAMPALAAEPQPQVDHVTAPEPWQPAPPPERWMPDPQPRPSAPPSETPPAPVPLLAPTAMQLANTPSASKPRPAKPEPPKADAPKSDEAPKSDDPKPEPPKAEEPKPTPPPVAPPAAPAPKPDRPCNGACIELPEPPKAGPLPQPSPWLPPQLPDRPEPAPQPGPSPLPAQPPHPF